VRRRKFKKYLLQAPKHYEKPQNQNTDGESGPSSDGGIRRDDNQSQDQNQQTQKPSRSATRSSRSNYDRGGFPNPVSAVFHAASSQLRQRLHPSSPQSGHHTSSSHHEKRGYLSFDHQSRARRNSHFPDLSHQEQYEIGHLEVQAMSLLAWVMIVYSAGAQLLAVMIWAPYFSAGHYTHPDFSNGFETSRTWFAFFEVGRPKNAFRRADGQFYPGILHV
jgi:hypothetical protein